MLTEVYPRQSSLISLPTLFDYAERGFTLVGLCFYAGALDHYFAGSAMTMIRYGLWVGAILLLLVRWQRSLYTALQGRLLWVIVGLSLMSFMWSLRPDYTLEMSREVMQMTTFGLYFASRFTLKDQLLMLAQAFGIIALLSLFYAIAQPSVGIHAGGPHHGAWRGVYNSKNIMSRFMTLGSMAFFALTIGRPKYRNLAWFGFGLSLGLVLMSTSKTGLVVSVLMILILTYYRHFRWQGKKTVLLLDLTILAVGCAIILVVSYWEPLLLGLGRDPTLTGRTLIWSGVIDKIQDQPWLGYGRAGFWGAGSTLAVEVGKGVSNNYVPPHAHNGFLDLIVEIGFIGTFFFVLSFFGTYISALKLAYSAESGEDFWPLGFLTLLVLYNITESELMRGESLYWVLYVAIVLTIGRHLRYRLQQAAARENASENVMAVTAYPVSLLQAAPKPR